MFDLKVVSKTATLFEAPVESAIFDGTESEFELLSFHQDLVGLLRQGEIIIDNKYKISILKGALTFRNNKCLVLVTEDEARRKKKS